MSKVAIVYHSGYGHTAVQAEAVRASAAAVPGTEVHLIGVSALTEGSPKWQHLDTSDAVIFGSPTYMAGPSAAFKEFMDATSSRYAEQAWADKLAAGFTNSAGINGDKLNTLQSFALFAMQHSMVWIGLGLPAGNSTLGGSPDELNRLAGFVGAMAQSPSD
ncbi:MAG TPA: flavodoxin family protein, partial [Mycobacterium sp.]